MLRPYIFTCTIESRRLASAHPKWGKAPLPQKKFNRENLKFALKFSVLDEITSGLVGVSSRDFFQSTSREAGGDNLGTIFTMHTPSGAGVPPVAVCRMIPVPCFTVSVARHVINM